MAKLIEISKPKTKLKKDFWALGGSLKSDIKLTNSQLKNTRESFSKNWARI